MMKVYLDIVLIINTLLDYNIFYIVNKILKRNTKLYRIILASLLGNISLIFLFININKTSLFIIKILLCILLCIIAFGFKNLKYMINNMAYVYMVSTIFGGILFFIKQNVISKYLYSCLIIILLPLVSIEIIKYFNKIKSNYKYYYLVKIMFKNNICIELNSFLDTGNKLVDPYTNKGIILVDINKIIGKINIRSPIYVPFKSLNNTGLIKCIKPQFIEINGKYYNNYLVGLSEEKFNIDGIDCLLNYKLMEELNV